MSISRKWPIARAIVYSGEGTWYAEARANTGVWVVREVADDPDFGEYGLRGAFFPFPEDDSTSSTMMLVMSDEARAALGMSVRTYVASRPLLVGRKTKAHPVAVQCGREYAAAFVARELAAELGKLARSLLAW